MQEVFQPKVSMMLFVLSAVVISTAIPAGAVVQQVAVTIRSDQALGTNRIIEGSEVAADAHQHCSSLSLTLCSRRSAAAER
jgi:hypothetical protein